MCEKGNSIATIAKACLLRVREKGWYPSRSVKGVDPSRREQREENYSALVMFYFDSPTLLLCATCLSLSPLSLSSSPFRPIHLIPRLLGSADIVYGNCSASAITLETLLIDVLIVMELMREFEFVISRRTWSIIFQLSILPDRWLIFIRFGFLCLYLINNFVIHCY